MGVRYYARTGKHSGVSMPIWLALPVLMTVGVVVVAFWAFALIALAVLAVIVVPALIYKDSQDKKKAQAKATETHAWLENHKIEVAARRAVGLEESKALVDQAMLAGSEEKRMLIAQAKRHLKEAWGGWRDDDAELALAHYIDQAKHSK